MPLSPELHGGKEAQDATSAFTALAAHAAARGPKPLLDFAAVQLAALSDEEARPTGVEPFGKGAFGKQD